MDRDWIEIEPGFAGYLALPPTGRGPGILLWQEIFGVNEHIRAVARQYAADGFVVLAPDVFWRQAPRVELGYEGEDRQRAMSLKQGYSKDDASADIRAAFGALKARPELRGPVGTIGYCMGGLLAWRTAIEADVAAAVALYGGGIQNELDAAGSLKCPLQFHFGGDDSHIPMDAVDKIRKAVQGLDAEVHVYAGAQHGFNCWERSSYHAPSAALSHGRATVFFAQHLLKA
ncbi:MAG: dienelactone hydrolase family protein [Pseudomonadota bacterium]|nr:dienelactone hydrolase family protein [Pseudomonadota bacterium]